ncbi:glutamyl-Q tRNA(Asp) ligase [Gordoniibacillus kamchatkensis]|uniref:Glutamyl-Q tRNA(Asp) synthetase n=1 Tax=Gordoniibacillus kamchatkensis TaxID=1590651 RepID=A0ABR5AK35_9BACL|nr:tRNA glutamyl-Q(34) synthetase GluQRS [Paenibacillus sp. VKM B-2647]KIL41415.1 glutamyl-Q tRNA(Asp) ligase [Paenibacillus sp. VKM B-2647]
MKRGRFAPTPSGQLHLGNARTALLAWLDMRSQGGQMVLRMEDIDKPRSRPELAAQIMDDLRWLGLDWDEGPDVAGPYVPYVQSGREELYEDAFARLLADGRLYPCYCSRAELLSMASAPHGIASEGPVYPGTCRSLSAAERERRAAAKKPSYRFAMPAHGFHYNDAVCGRQYAPPGAGGDFVVRRADGIIGYQLAVVVDDAAMGITDVLRGHDLLDSTPRQLALYEALGLPAPRFAHVPLVLAADGERLAKRHGSAFSLAALRAAGTAPERVVGALAFLCGLIDKLQPVPARELTAGFTLALVPREPVRLTNEIARFLIS